MKYVQIKATDFQIVLCSIFTVMFSLPAFSQKESVYVKFVPNSNKTYYKENGTGAKIKEHTYRLAKLNDGRMIFYIKDLMFIHDKSKMVKGGGYQKNKNVDKKDLLVPKDIEKYIGQLQEKYPFGNKSKDIINIFIAYINEDNTITLYPVRWQYYIE